MSIGRVVTRCAPLEADGLNNHNTHVCACLHPCANACIMRHLQLAKLCYMPPWEPSQPRQGRDVFMGGGGGLRTLLGCSDLTDPRPGNPLFLQSHPHIPDATPLLLPHSRLHCDCLPVKSHLKGLLLRNKSVSVPFGERLLERLAFPRGGYRGSGDGHPKAWT